MPEGKGKKIWFSKTFWVNLVALVAMIIQGVTGKEILGLEMQAGILGFINIILRLVTKEEIVWED
jgi:uncharacterized membrane protein